MASRHCKWQAILGFLVIKGAKIIKDLQEAMLIISPEHQSKIHPKKISIYIYIKRLRGVQKTPVGRSWYIYYSFWDTRPLPFFVSVNPIGSSARLHSSPALGEVDKPRSLTEWMLGTNPEPHRSGRVLNWKGNFPRRNSRVPTSTDLMFFPNNQLVASSGF